MKNKIKAMLLAAGLTASLLGTYAFAETATEAVTETATETSAAESETGEAASEAAQEVTAESKYAPYYDIIEESVTKTLGQLSDMPEDQLDTIINEGQNASQIAIASNWKSVREELGNFVEVVSQEITEEGDVIIVTSKVIYDGVSDKTEVIVTYTDYEKNSTGSLEWEIKYPMSKLMEQAGLNTLMGMGIVFCVLIFLSLIIGQLHWIPDLMNGKKKERETVSSTAPAASAPVLETVEEEDLTEDLTDDLELVAVISAAIAASENTSADGFVVRSIKKANRRKWLNA